MPYTVALPDGRRVEFPDEVSKDTAAGIIRKQFNLPGPETTIVGNVKEAFKGLVPGAVSLVEGAVTGASAMLPEEYEKATREKTKQIASAIKAPFAAAPGYEDSVVRKLSESVGSTAPFFAMGPLGLIGRGLAVGTGVAAGAGEARTRAEESGATGEQRRAATGLGAVIGSTEALPVFSFLKKIGKPAEQTLLAAVRRAALTGGEEGAQEAAAAALQNLVAKGVYKPDQSIIEGTGEAGAYGAGTGAIIQGITDMALGRRAKGAKAPAPGEAPAKAPIDVAAEAEAARAAQEAAKANLLSEDYIFELASGPNGYAEVAKYKADLLGHKKTPEVKTALAAATKLLQAEDVAEYNRIIRDRQDLADAVKERGLPTPETSAFNLPTEEVVETPATEVVPEPKVRKKGAKNVAVPPVVESGEATAIEPDGAGTTVAGMGVDSQPNAVTAPVQTETEGVGVSELPAADGNAPEGLAAPTVKLEDGRPFTVVDQDENKLYLKGAGGTTTVMRGSNLGKYIAAQLEPVAEVPTPTVEAPAAIEAPAVEPPAVVEAPAVEPPAVVEAPAVEALAEQPAVEEPAAPTVETLTVERDKLLTPKGKVPAPKSKARKQYDALQAQIDELTPTVETPEVEAPAVQQVRKFVNVEKDEVTLALDRALDSKQKAAEFRGKYPEFIPIPMVSNIKKLLDLQNDPSSKPEVRQQAKDALEENFTQKEIDAAADYKEADSRYNVQALKDAVPTPDGFAETAAKGQTRKALQVVLNHPQADPITKLVISSILKAGTLPKLSVVPEGTFGVDAESKKVRVGEYDPVSDTIRLDAGYVTAANLIHEIMHGFLHRKIVDHTSGVRKDAQVQRIEDLYKYLSENHPELAESYGMTDLSEFTSEVMSNGSFQDKLRDIPYKKSNIFREFAKAVLKLLGINDTTPKWNALAEALISTESVMQSGRLLQEARTGIPDAKSVSNITTPGAVAAAANADIIGETVRPTAISALRKFFSTKVNKTYLFDKLNSIDEKLTAGYLGRLRDALGNINPKELLAQAMDAARLTERAFVEGFLELTPDGMFTAAKGKLANGNDASLTRIIEIVNNSAKQSGESIETTRRVLSSMLVGHREFNLDAHNKATGSSVPLRIKDDVKRNDLERQFQANPDAQEIYAIMEAMRFNRIDMMVHSGRISQDTADFWKNTPGYVPYQDIDNLNDKIATIKNGSAKGLAGTSKYLGLVGPDTSPQVGDVIDSFMDLMARMSLDAIKVNAVSKASKAMTLLGHAKRILPAASLSQEEKTHTVDTYVNGVRARYYYKDALDAAAFAGMPSEISSVVSGLQTFARTLRSGVTLVPAFAVGQVLNDVFRAYAQSDVMRPAALIPRILLNFPAVAYRQYTGKKSVMDTRMENMGVMATFDVSTEGTLKNILQQVGAEKRSLREQVLHIAESISKGSDMAVRQAIYAQSMKETGDEALSMARAREIINFSRRGQSNALDMVIRTVPFTNAYIRGMDKLITAARGTTGAYGMTRAEAKAMFRNRMLTLGAIGFTYALMMAGDDEYEKLDDSIRDTHFVFPGLKIGDSPVAIPLPRDLAFIFKAIPERIVNYVRKYGTPEEQSGIRVIGELLKQGAGTIAAPNVTPTVLLPILENIANYSAFLGRPLESQSQQTRASFLASGRGTSEVSKELSKGLSAVSKGLSDVGLGSIGSLVEVSPVKLENLFRGLLGTSGALLLAMGDEIIAPERADKTAARSVLAQLTGASALMVDPVGRKQLNDFFDLYDKLSEVGNSLKYLEEKDPEEAVKYAREHEPELNVLDEAKIIYQDIQALNKDTQEVDLDKSMSGKQKLEAISKFVREQNLTAKKVDELKSYLDKHR